MANWLLLSKICYAVANLILLFLGFSIGYIFGYDAGLFHKNKKRKRCF